MATLTIRNHRPIIQVLVAGQRRTISLGGFSEKQSRAILNHVEHIASARASGTYIDPATAKWLTAIDAKLHQKMVDVGLLRARQTKQATQLGAYFDAYIARRTDLKPRTILNLKQTRKVCVDHFGEGTDMISINRGMVKDWQRAMLDTYSTATVAGFVKKMREVFADAIDRKLLTENPFKAVKIGSFVNESRMEYVPAETIEKVIASTPVFEWKLIFAMARYAGLRVPSETRSMRCADIDWLHNRFTVRENKTKARIVPIFPELRPHLWAVHRQRTDGYLFEYLRWTNLGTTARKIIERSGVRPWEKTFQNLRASAETDLAQRFPIHVACKWIGNSEAIAKKHYLQVTEQHFADAVRAAPEASWTTGDSSEKGGFVNIDTLKPSGGKGSLTTLGGNHSDASDSVLPSEKTQQSHLALQAALHPVTRNAERSGKRPSLARAFKKIRRAISTTETSDTASPARGSAARTTKRS